MNNLWLLVPAAGIGQRMGASLPKQYLPLAGKNVLYITLSRLHLAVPHAQLVVSLNAADQFWPQIQQELLTHFPRIKIHTCIGGAERSDSVLAGLNAIQTLAQPNDWVLVHDAARPCITKHDLNLLINSLTDHPCGGLLATPVADTLKQGQATAAGNLVQTTIPRAQVWHALTPQMFRYGLLTQALITGLEKNLNLTDEASALEAAGLQPMLIAGRRDNLKITHPEDLALAELILAAQQANLDKELQ